MKPIFGRGPSLQLRLFLAVIISVAAIVAYRFDGTKESSEQTKALTDVMRTLNDDVALRVMILAAAGEDFL